MSNSRIVLIALLILAVGLLSVSCGQAKSEGVPHPIAQAVGERTRLIPEPIATQSFPTRVSSNESDPHLPLPVETVQALATSSAKGSTIIAAQTATAEAIAKPVLQKDYGSWSFTAYRRPELIDYHWKWETWAFIEYDDCTVENLKAFASANQELGAQLINEAGEMEVFITFHNYIPPEQFSKWASNIGLHLKRTELGVLFEKNTCNPPCTPTPTPFVRPWVSIPPDKLAIESQPGDTEPLPRASIDEALAKLGQRYPEYHLRVVKGVYFTWATVEAGQLPRIASDPSVFLADVTHNWVRRELRTTKVEGADNVKIPRTRLTDNVFPQMERFGLDNFQQ